HLEQQYLIQAAKLREIDARLIRVDISSVDPVYCQLRSLKKEQAYATNSVRMHDYFFENLGGEECEPCPELISALNKDFGSLQEWERQFKALGLCSRGWVVLGFDLKEGKLQNYFSDDHSEGIWSVLPILVLDVYEHAYCLDYSSRVVYIEEFMKKVEWRIVRKRFRTAKEIFKQSNSIFRGADMR
ncbi:MAG: Fe-Mn family superoxide dismutase, partial [Peptococcaceae bacterium]|nr:Fe-Mn family superoxide dismutase [Peptococcaceae bacterium]